MKRRLGIILGIVILVVLVALLFIVPAITGGETAEGNWELTSAVIDDVTVSDTSTLDFELFLLLNADGTGTLTFSQGDAACTWRQHGATVTVVTEDREPQPFTLEEDGTLTWVTEDMTFILSRMDDAAAANAPEPSENAEAESEQDLSEQLSGDLADADSEHDAQIAEHSVEAIQQRGTLRVALQAENSKMSYRVPEGIEEYADRAGQPSGYVPFICRQLAEDLGVTLEFVFYDVTEQQIQAAENGEADISANVWSITEERLEQFTMTNNILVTDIEGDEVFLRADPENPGSPLIDSEEALAVARIAAVKATVQVNNTLLQYPEAEVVPYADNAAALDALLSGEVDAAVFSTFDKAFADILVEAIQDQRICQCEYEIVNPEIKGVGFILKKGNTDLCDYINERLALYRSDGLLQELNDLCESEARAMGII